MRTTPVLALLCLLASSSARADRRDLYLVLEGAPALLQADDAVDGATGATRLGVNGQVGAYYGLTNRLHVGAVFRGVHGGGFAYEDKTLSVSGTRAVGTFRQSLTGFGAAALLLFRPNLGSDFAPVARLELGGTQVHHTGLVFEPAGLSQRYEFDSLTELVWGARVVLAAEYRFLDSFVASVGLGFRQNFNALAQRQFELPILVGYVW